jgi:cation:H+ antiporter
MTKARPPGVPNPKAAMSLLWLAVFLSLPGIALRLYGFHPADGPFNGILFFGVTIVSAAFLLTWAAEVAEIDIGGGLAVVFLALVTVLPEYAVDVLLSWKAGYDPAYKGLALANMTGANRILIGLGWPLVALIIWYRENRTHLDLHRHRSVDVVWLIIATGYSLLLPLKGSLGVYDAALLFLCYGLYVKGSSVHEHDAPVLVGPPRVMGGWDKGKRRKTTLVLFVFSAVLILATAEHFTESLIEAGQALHVDRILLIQWLAPLASESPEFVVVILLTLRGRSEMGFGAFVSSKINQWTLLIGGVPLAYAISSHTHGHGFPIHMELTEHQVAELWLTATQGLYAVATIIDLRFSLGQALLILGLFLLQTGITIGISIVYREDLEHATHLIEVFHLWSSALYGVLALERFFVQRRELAQRFKDVFGKRGMPPEPPAPPGDPRTPDVA